MGKATFDRDGNTVGEHLMTQKATIHKEARKIKDIVFVN